METRNQVWLLQAQTKLLRELAIKKNPSLRDVVKIKPLWQLEVELDGGTLVGTAKGIHYHNVNLTKIRCKGISREIAKGGSTHKIINSAD